MINSRVSCGLNGTASLLYVAMAVKVCAATLYLPNDFSDGLCAINSNGFWGFVNTAGKMVVRPQYHDASDFSGGIAPVATAARRWMYIDQSGSVRIPGPFESALPVSEGLALVMAQGQWGYVDVTGKMTIETQFEEASSFSEGRAFVKSAGVRYCIDATGKRVFTLSKAITRYGNFKEGLATVIEGGKWGYLEARGNMAIAPQFDLALDFSQGYAAVAISNLWGYVDRSGTFKIKPRFTFANSFSEGLAAAKLQVADTKTEKYGFINATGEFVINPIFDSAYPFRSGFAVVRKGEGFGLIDTTGVFRVTPKYCYMRSPSNGIVTACLGHAIAPENVALITTGDQIIWSAK